MNQKSIKPLFLHDHGLSCCCEGELERLAPVSVSMLNSDGREFWKDLKRSRDEFFSDRIASVARKLKTGSIGQGERCAIVVDGGRGKTTLLGQIQYLIAKSQSGHSVSDQVAIMLPLAELRDNWQHVLCKPAGEDGRTLACRQFLQGLHKWDTQEYRSVISDWLRQEAINGNLWLLVDALDEATIDEAGQRLMALKNVLGEYTRLNCVVASRVAMVNANWADFFADESSGNTSSWCFLKPQELAYEQIERYLEHIAKETATSQPDLMTIVRLLGEPSLAVVRTIDAIRELAGNGDLVGVIRNRSELYWRIAKYYIDKDTGNLRRDSGIATRREKIDVLREIANAMAARNDDSYLPCQIDETFRNRFGDRWQAVEMLVGAEVSLFRCWRSDGRLDSFQWIDPWMQDFFLGWYLLDQTGETQWSTLSATGSEYRNATRFAVEMSASQVDDFRPATHAPLSNNFGRICRNLFSPEQQGRRPVDLMFAAWPELLVQAELLESDWSRSHDVFAATAKISRKVFGNPRTEPWRQFDPAGKFSPKDLALEMVENFLSEYPAGLRNAVLPIVSQENSFVTPGGIGPLQLSQIQVTNNLYDEFDKMHCSLVKDYRKLSPYPNGPVVKVTWYEAMMFAIWAHARLPSPEEWKYACKVAGVEPDCFQWCDENSANPESASSPIVRHAHTVGCNSGDGCQVFDMLGNAFEWTSEVSSWFPLKKPRIFGGSYLSLSWTLQDRRHYWREWSADDREVDHGIRLARDILAG